MRNNFIQTDFYKFEIDREINRGYITFVGVWTLELVPNYIRDIELFAKELKKDFTLIADIRKFITGPVEITKLHIQAQKILKDSGLQKAAEIENKSLMQKISSQKYVQESGMERYVFSNIEDAEKYLNQIYIKN